MWFDCVVIVHLLEDGMLDLEDGMLDSFHIRSVDKVPLPEISTCLYAAQAGI
jgi:hypothetical protein